MENLQSKMYATFDVDPAPISRFVGWMADSYQLPWRLKVLDIGCGPGRMLREYSHLGWRVTGMEPDSDFFLNAVDAMMDVPEVGVLKGGFCQIDFHNEIDLITAINNPFSYLLDIPSRVEALQRVYRALTPGGVVFLELTNFLHRLQHYEPVTVQDKKVDGDTITHVIENYVDVHHARWLLRDLYMVKGKSDVVVKYHEQAVITLPELTYLLEQQGFTCIRTYSGYETLSPGPVVGKNILISAQKPV